MYETDRVARQRKRYSLHFTLSIAFIGLLTLVGVTLIGFQYVVSRRTALVGAEDQLLRIDRHIRASVSGLYVPAQNIVDLSSKTLPSEAPTEGNAIDALGYATEILRIRREIDALFVGWDDGQFRLARYLDDEAREHAAAPPEARFLVSSIGPDAAGIPRRESRFFDDERRLLATRPEPDDGFDPRTRDWYRMAIADSGQIATGFYPFHSTGEIGVTLARRLSGATGVVGVDLTLRGLEDGLAALKVTPETRIAMLEPDGRIIALANPTAMRAWNDPENDTGRLVLPLLSQLGDPVYTALERHLTSRSGTGRFDLDVDGRTWFGSISERPTPSGETIVLATLVPRDELLADVDRLRDRSLLLSAVLVALALLVVVGLSRHLSGTLRALAREAERIRRLQFDTPIDIRSRIVEVDELIRTMASMQSSVQQFLEISHGLSSERDFDRLLAMILDEARRVTGARAGAILLRSGEADGDGAWSVGILQGPADPTDEVDAVARPVPGAHEVDRSSAGGRIVRIESSGAGHGCDLSGLAPRFGLERDGSIRSLLSVPLRTSKGAVIGILQLVDAVDAQGRPVGFGEETVPYVEALSSDAAVALDNRRLLEAQKELLESFIHVVAGAIDAKSPYTHGHCQRVPEIATMLAEAAEACADGPLAGFRMSDEQRWALHLASWLHDCGKVTTPEYVVDKATKLETLYNRIHEIRTRFEVLWRDGEIAYWKGVLDDPTNEPALRRRMDRDRAIIRDDFAFVAACNTGDEPMTDDRIDRIRRIASRTWTRNLDDSLGLSHGEREQRGDPAALPVEEPLLADRPHHLVPRAADGHPFGDGALGFRMDVPQHQYHRGEVHNLCVRRGTLTPEERFKINEHVIQTLRMLDRLPFPEELREVPDWAGNHHERLDGKGYPRRLAADDLSVPERIMAIADVYEALTASDRPYMHPKTLSKALFIMRSMRDDGHLCPDLFDLFVRSGVYHAYAERHLRPEQIDPVDPAVLLGEAGESRSVAKG